MLLGGHATASYERGRRVITGKETEMSQDQKKPTHRAISEEQVAELGNYLAKRPWDQVHRLIQMLATLPTITMMQAPQREAAAPNGGA